jgi:hypothetical protein
MSILPLMRLTVFVKVFFHRFSIPRALPELIGMLQE